MYEEDEATLMSDMERMLGNALSRPHSPASPLSPPLHALGAALRRWAPAGAYGVVWRAAVRRMLASRREEQCQLRSVSQLIEELALPRIDLLKIDVERAELDVLRGVAPTHWPLVHAVAAEVHERNLEGVLGLLRVAAGFPAGGVCVEQEAGLQGTSLCMVYAVRGEPNGG